MYSQTLIRKCFDFIDSYEDKVLSKFFDNDEIDLIRNMPKPVFTIDFVLQQVSIFSGISIGAIKSKSRLRGIVDARHIFFYIAHEVNDISLMKLGKFIGKRNHATVIHAIKKVNDIPELKTRAYYYLCKMNDFNRV